MLKSKIEIQLNILSYLDWIVLIDKLFFSKDFREDIDFSISKILDLSSTDISMFAKSFVSHL